MTDPARIAAALSPAQRKALMWLPEDGSERPWYAGSGSFDGHKDLRGLLLASGKIDRSKGVMMRWMTTLGQQVRAVIDAAERDTR